MSAIDNHLERTRARLHRLEPHEALAAVSRGAILVDIRPQELRHTTGAIPDAVVIERNVLEWRLDPTSPHRIPQIEDADQAVIIFCQEGYASSLAAASLQDIGLRNATDLVGGFRDWAAEGLRVERPELLRHAKTTDGE